MSTYVIGDIHGCDETLQILLAQCGYRSQHDRLFLVGDLINRGPGSLEVLRWAKAGGDRIVTVLGNHDLHLVATALGVRPARERDHMHSVFDAPDGEELIAWLRERPLLHREHGAGSGWVLVHAGLHPDWTVEEAQELARETEAGLRGSDAPELLAGLYRKQPVNWSRGLRGNDRLAAALKVFVAIRTCRTDGSLCVGFAGPPREAPPDCTPWFRVPERRSRGERIYFGHWAALGYHREGDVVALDSGCAWGGHLTAVRVEDDAVFQEPLADPVDDFRIQKD
ncbi:MAG: symmetrical bis(5'-nucleosyl)-tetraphosphatase [Planctomycetota bacterium]